MFRKTFNRILPNLRKAVVILGLLILGLAPAAAQTLGDVNEDGSVTSVDALIIAQYAIDPLFYPLDEAIADVNCDNSVTIIDALIVAQYVVGLIKSWPCEAAQVIVSHIRGIQCETTYYETMNEARRALESGGVTVLNILVQQVPVITLCGVGDGVTYVALIPGSDLAAALALGWSKGGMAP